MTKVEVSRKWLSTVVSAEESSTQVQVAFTRALIADGKDHLLEHSLLEELRCGVVPDGDELPVLLALSDNGPHMTSKSTKAFLAGARIATHFGRPGTPNNQAWIESLFGHVKTEHPHLEKITDPAKLERELDHIQQFHNTVRLHQGLGYVTPDDEHRPRRRHPRRPASRTASRPRGQGCGPTPATKGSPVNTPAWLGITPPLWCIWSDTPRPANEPSPPSSTWRPLTKLRCCPRRATTIVAAIRVLQTLDDQHP